MIQRMDHVGIIVDDLAAAIEFFVELGLELQGRFSVAGVSATSHSPSMTSTPSSPACEPAAWSSPASS